MTADTEKKGFFRRVLFFLKLVEIRLRFVAILVITALVVGYWDNIQNYYERWQRTRHPQETAGREGQTAGAAESAFEFFCPMHQFVVRDRAGKCPICGMDLVQRKKGAAVVLPEGVLRRVQVSPERIMQAGVQIVPVAYRLLARTVRSYGTIEPDETKVAKIIARFPGRVDELMIAATGLVVKKGEPLARIYSPKFLAAAQEYVQALASQRAAENDSQAGADTKRRAREIADYARRRLALAGFTEEQLDAIAKGGKADEYVALHSPLAGTVLEKNVFLGQMVDEGTTLYTIADLSALWVQVQIVESDLAAVKVGMSVEVDSVAWSGEIFYGTVDFIWPTVSTETRSVKVRVVVANRDNKLKPGMYVIAVIRSPFGRYGEIGSANEPKVEPEAKAAVQRAEGSDTSGPARREKAPTEVGTTNFSSAPMTRAMQLPTTTDTAARAFLASLPSGAEYYTCSMHPEVVSDKPGDCPKCGMHLEKKTKAGEPPATFIADEPSNEHWAEGYTCPMHLDRLQPKGGVCQICGCGMETTKWRIERVLSIPETTVIDTGIRQIVYVEAMPGVYDAKAVTFGPRAGAYYPVLGGLAFGDRVVARGSFLIDAEARLNPSTVSNTATTSAPATSAGSEMHHHGG